MKFRPLLIATLLVVAAGCGGRDEPDAEGPAGRFTQVDRLQSADPETALTLCRAILESPADDAERAETRRRIPPLLWSVYSRRKNARDYAGVEAAVRELTTDWKDSPEAGYARHWWPDDRSQWALEAIQEADEALVDRLVAEMLSDPEPRAVPGFLDDYQAFQIDRMRAALARGDAAGANALIDSALSFYDPRGQVHEIEEALAEAWPPGSLLSTADACAAAGKDLVAIAFLRAAWRALSAKRLEVDPEEVLSRQDDCAFRLAAAIREGRVPGAPADHAQRLLSQVRTDSPRQRERVRRERLATLLSEARAYAAAKNWFEARRSFLRTRVEALEAWMESAEGGPLPADLPADVAARLEGRSDRERLRSLFALVREGGWAPPLREVREIDAALIDVGEGEGLSALASNHLHALDVLRPVLRAEPAGDRAERIAAALRARIGAARARSDFAALYDLTGFYVSEFGPPGSSDPFRPQLASALESAAEHFASKSPMRRLFLRALLAESFPERTALAGESLDEGFQLTEKASFESPQPTRTLPSGLVGWSVLAMDNATPYHLLVFFRGPERFFARLDPFRRGTVVVADGEYEMAVVVTQDEVQPYRERNRFESTARWSSYVIKEGEGGAPSTPSALGDYRLLRVPEGAGTFEIDGGTGIVRLRGR